MELTNDRTATITIGGTDYPLILTTLATKAIGERYGGLENLGEKLMQAENFALAISEINWLIILLANQAILRHNYQNKDTPKDLLTEDFIELFTAPHELATYKTAITEAMFNGTKRHIESQEGPGKNQPAV